MREKQLDSKMAAGPDSLEYHLTFPNPNFNYNQNNADSDFVFVMNEKKLPVILLFGWAGCKDKYLAKYSKIYEEKGLITLRYTPPVKWLFMQKRLMLTIGEKLVKLISELNFENHPVFVHCFSNGGAFVYQNFSHALDKNPKEPVKLKGVIYDSAPGRRRVTSLFRALTAILDGNVLYSFSMSFLMTMFLSAVWLYEVVSSQFYAKDNVHSNNPFGNLLKEKNRCPQLFIYSLNDNLIPHSDIEYFADMRKQLGVNVTLVRYDNSLHVKHLPENRDSYVSSVFQFINKCLNGTN